MVSKSMKKKYTYEYALNHPGMIYSFIWVVENTSVGLILCEVLGFLLNDLVTGPGPS